MNWTATSDATSKEIRCPRCRQSIVDCLPSADHHPVQCPHCRAKLLLFSASARNFAVDVDNAPDEIREFVTWAQQSLDEVQFVSLLLTFEELLGITP